MKMQNWNRQGNFLTCAPMNSKFVIKQSQNETNNNKINQIKTI